MAKARYTPRFGRDIRIKPDTAQIPVKARPCGHAGCREEGVCRAPKSPHNMSAHVWLCAAHAREHNEHWDYFAGMSEVQIERFRTAALVGHRPTWPLGKRAAGVKLGHGAFRLDDGYEVFAAADVAPEPRRAQRVLTPLQRQAFDMLDLEGSASLNEIKARYKELVKRFHPDAHGGDRGTEERLKQVIKAYGVLRAAGLT